MSLYQEREDLLLRARMEWEEDGVLSVDTYFDLTHHGVDADALIDNFNQQEEPHG